jgi:hypothetical protein
MKEMDLKIKLVEHLIKCSTNYDQIINSEFSFQFGSKRADIVLISGDEATVFEIKSERDNTERLANQIENYKKYFDYCYVVCEKSNLKNIREKTPKNIGIIMISDDVQYVRYATKIKRLDKLSLVSTLPTRVLNKISSKPYRDKFSLCEQITKENTCEVLKLASRKAMRDSISSIYVQFLEEIGSIITADDIYQLSRAPAKNITINYKPEVLSNTLEVIK